MCIRDRHRSCRTGNHAQMLPSPGQAASHQRRAAPCLGAPPRRSPLRRPAPPRCRPHSENSGRPDGAATFPDVYKRQPFDILMELAKKGLVCADSFQPVRQWLKQDTMKKSPARQRVSARVKAMNAGRWDVVRPLCSCSMDQMLDRAFDRAVILCRETAAAQDLPWQEALETLRVWEDTCLLYTSRCV